MRRLRLFLRDHRILDASAHIPAGQSLAAYLASRTRYVNVTAVDWVGTGETIDHMALKVDAVLWASSRDGDVELSTPIGPHGTRQVDIEMEGGYLVSADLPLVDDQRVGDYLQSAPGFIPLRHARLRPRGTMLGDVVLNQGAIRLVRERAGDADDVEPAGDPAAAHARESAAEPAGERGGEFRGDEFRGAAG